MRTNLWLIACIGLLQLAALAVAQDEGPQRKRKPRDRPGEFTAKAARQERLPETLKVGDAAPDFTLADPAAKREVQLSTLQAKRPVVLVFGSCTCPPFRRQIAELEKLYAAHKEKVDFYLIYIREAHPGSKIPQLNGGRPIEQTETLEARSKLAAEMATGLGVTMPVLVDREDNRANIAYSGWPIRLVIVGTDGKIAHYSGQGPRGFKLAEVQAWLKDAE
jgi:thyroxine 5-deiodinase